MGKANARFNISAKDKTRAAFSSVNKKLKGLGGTLTSTQAKILGLVGVGGFGALVTSSANASDALAKKADQLDINIQKLAGLQHATKLYTDVGAPAMNEALVKASKRLGEFNATGGGAAGTWLKTLNLDTEKLAQLQPDELFNEYAQAIGGLNSRGEQLAAISALMGDESRALHPLIMAGTDAIRESTEEAIAFGTALTRVDAAKIEDASDTMTRVGEVMRGIGTNIAVDLSPIVTMLGEKFIVAGREANGFKGDVLDSLEAIALGSAGVLDELEAPLGFIKDTSEDIWAGFRALPTWAQEVGVVGAIMGGRLGKVTLVTMAKFMADSKTTADWWAAYSEGHVGFMEWMTSGGTEAETRLKKLRDAGVKFGSEVGEKYGPLFDDGDDSDSKLSARKAKVKSLFKELRAEENKTTSEGEDDGGQKDKGLVAVNPRLQQKLQQLSESLLAEEDRIALSYQRRAELVAANASDEQQRKSLLLQLEEQHQANLLRIHSNGAIKMARFDDTNWKDRTTATAQWMKGITATVATQNRAAFELNKVAAFSEGVLALRETVVGAYKVGAKIGGPYLGGLFAGIAGGAQAINLAGIANSKFGGGGGAFSGGGGGGANAVPTYDANPTTGFPADTQQQQSTPNTIQIVIQGDAVGWNDNMVDAVANGVRDAVANKDYIIVDSGTRQHAVLQETVSA